MRGWGPWRGVFVRGVVVCLGAQGGEHGRAHGLCCGPAHKADQLRLDLGAGVVIGASTGEHVFRGRVEKDNES